MKRNVVKIVNQMLIWGGACNLYKIILYRRINKNKDYEMSSFNTRVFS